ncbi:aftiphilin [Megalops cyprinoides]|uniref:aftiphilin n=1 Tax=Megalops cyprinoides TaxID=118141 RepID=UPI001863C5F4|nr:aftiphilin [Megalops cyprinoides]
MEPDIVRLHPSSPPPLEDAPEEDEDDFGGFSGVSASVSFSEFETPVGFGQSHAADTSPPGLFSPGSAGHRQGAPGSGVSDDGLRDPGSSRDASVSTENLKRLPVPPVGRWAEHSPHDCNGDVAEVLTNGFAELNTEGDPSGGPRPEGRCACHFDTPVERSQAPGRAEHTENRGQRTPLHCKAGSAQPSLEENGVTDSHSTGSASPAGAPEGLANGEVCCCGGEESEHSDTEPCTAQRGSSRAHTDDAAGEREGEAGWAGQSAVAPGAVGGSASEDFGEFSTAGPVPSPSSPESASPADRPEEDAGGRDLSQARSEERDGFADFEPTDAGEFGDFGTPDHCTGQEAEHSQGDVAGFPGSDSFADFCSAPVGADADAEGGWNAFGEQEEGQAGGHSWACFTEEQSSVLSEESEDRWRSCTAATAPPAGSPQTCRRDSVSASLAARLDRLFRVSFPERPVPEARGEVRSLRVLLEPPDGQREAGEHQSTGVHRELQAVWRQLQDVDDAVGLRYQWGGSHSNKTLLCSLGIDTRNILFTGQKKQPVIVPMYAASLGMLEPTKEPLKPMSAAEKIASIAQGPPGSPDMSTSPDPSQEALPPVQFDWSSSGLTNPLDASGGSSLLNLDFFGPVEDTSCSSASSLPGVDLELYELPGARPESGSTSSPVSDAFARLMSTAERTSTSARRPRKEEHLSEEASKVIVRLPDLSFMQAKVLMFPSTLTPLFSSVHAPE